MTPPRKTHASRDRSVRGTGTTYAGGANASRAQRATTAPRPNDPHRQRGHKDEAPQGTTKLSRSITRVSSWLDSHPGIDYLMIRIIVFLLTGIGVVMVMSSSMTWSVIEDSGVWGAALRQSLMVFIGFLGFWACLKIPPQVIRKWSGLALGVSLILLIAVLIPGIGTGRDEVGSQSWIALGPIRFQPSEIAKIGLAIFGASFLANRVHAVKNVASRFNQFAVIAAVFIALVFFEGDVGMAATVTMTAVALMFFAGMHRYWIVGAIVGAFTVAVALIAGGGFRSHRFHVYFDALFGRFEDTRGTAFQSYQGFLSLADGSVTGVGLGQSRAKWFYLPEARNDFIFAIVGEELGLWGGALVIVLFFLLGFFGLRTAMRAQDQFQSLLAATLTIGVVAQAFINIAYVVGLLPVTGIQLPMISAGGTSAVITLVAMGILANIARHEPEAVSAVRSYGRPFFDRLLFIGEPVAPAEVRSDGTVPRGRERGFRDKESAERAERQARFGVPVTERRTRDVGSAEPVNYTSSQSASRGRYGERYDLSPRSRAAEDTPRRPSSPRPSQRK